MKKARVVRIKNTMNVEGIFVSESIYDGIKNIKDFEII